MLTALMLNPRSSILNPQSYSLRLRARHSHRFAPLSDFGFEECRELLGRIADEFSAFRRDAVGHLGNLDDANHFGVQFIDDVARSAGRHRDAEPRAGLEAFEPLLV